MLLTRQDVIERAIVDLRNLKSVGGVTGLTWEYRDTNGVAYNGDFEVSEDTRTVTCYLRGFNTNEVLRIGVATTEPTEVFNVYISKAVALRRALRLPIPDDYVNPPTSINAKIGDTVIIVDNAINHYFDIGDKVEILHAGPYMCDAIDRKTNRKGNVSHGDYRLTDDIDTIIFERPKLREEGD